MTNEVTTPVQRPVCHDDGPLSHILDTARFDQMNRVAMAMAAASLTPDHLRGKTEKETVGNCIMVVNQAVKWDADPFAVAAETYVVHGRLGYQGKLIAAIVNARAGLQGRLTYEHSGAGDNRKVVVSGTFKGEKEPRTVELSVGQAKTDNKMWKSDPDQKLCYSGAIRWARRHCPEIMLGIYTDDDLDRMTNLKSEVVRSAESINNVLFNSPPKLIEQAPDEPTEESQLSELEQACEYIRAGKTAKDRKAAFEEMKAKFSDPEELMELEDAYTSTLDGAKQKELVS